LFKETIWNQTVIIAEMFRYVVVFWIIQRRNLQRSHWSWIHWTLIHSTCKNKSMSRFPSCQLMVRPVVLISCGRCVGTKLNLLHYQSMSTMLKLCSTLMNSTDPVSTSKLTRVLRYFIKLYSVPCIL